MFLLAQSIATTQPSSPGSSPAHWTTLTFVCATLAAFLVFACAVLIQRALLAKIKKNLAARIFVYFSEAISAVVLSVLASYFDVFKKSTYIPTEQYHPDWHVLFWAAIWAGFASYHAVVKLFGIVTKESEESASKKLATELEKEQAAVRALGRQRDLLVKIMAFAKQMVSRKIKRLGVLAQSQHVTPQKFVAELNPSLQVQSLVKLIHEFFKRGDISAGKLRLALWMASPSLDSLSAAYSWDGETDNCFSGKSKDRMKLSTPLGTLSEVVRCYHSQAPAIKIIPDCVKAAERHEFEFFYPEQERKVRSMVLYKHVFTEQANPVAVVLLLVSSATDYFRQEDRDEIKQFLDEMLTRIEMEWIVLELVEDLELEKEGA